MQRPSFVPNEMTPDVPDPTIDRAAHASNERGRATERPGYIVRSLNDWPTVVVLERPDPADFS